MVNRPKIVGTAAETGVVTYLSENGFPGAERRSLQGSVDKGDVTGCPGLCWEVKAGRTLCLPAWLRETEKERRNAKADYGILAIKPVGYGVTRVGKWWASMYHLQWRELAAACGVAPQGDPPIAGFLNEDVLPLSGGRILDLRDTVRRLPDPMYSPIQTFLRSLPYVLINPKGVRDPDRYYTVTTMEQMVAMVRIAGYGTPYDYP